MTTVAAPRIGQAAATPSGRLRVHRTHWAAILASVAVFAGVVTVVARVLHTNVPADGCVLTTSCVTPPAAPLLGPSRPFVSPVGFAFDERSDCDTASSWQLDSQTANAVAWVIGNGFPLGVSGGAIGTRSADDIADAFAAKLPPGATLVFRIPGAELGGYPGIGRVYDATVSSSDGTSEEVRGLVIVAVRHGVGVAVTAVGPYQADTQQNDFDHANPSATHIGECLRGMVNTVQWAGDPQP